MCCALFTLSMVVVVVVDGVFSCLRVSHFSNSTQIYLAIDGRHTFPFKFCIGAALPSCV